MCVWGGVCEGMKVCVGRSVRGYEGVCGEECVRV